MKKRLHRFCGIAISRGLISEAQAIDAIRLQQTEKPGTPIGQVLVQLGWLNSDQVNKILDVQKNLRDSHADTQKRKTPLREQNIENKPKQLSGGREFRKGEVIGNYQILERLGRGGMGAVYSALSLRLSRKVALKVMTSEALGDAENIARFTREAKVISNLKHPNIVTLYEFGDLPDGGYFYTMDLAFVGVLPDGFGLVAVG